MKNKFLIILLLFAGCLTVSSLNSYSQVTSDSYGDSLPKRDSVDIYDMTLEQLMNLKAHGIPSHLEALVNTLIAAASKKPLSIRETPSIITLITEEEIKKSGARDLIDLLRMVPGIDFGIDILGVVGVGMRGNWGQEGKVLMMIDGQEMNEVLSSTLQFGNHYSADQIKKIEIIRGPGSAIYGGFAEYGVINIITKSAEDINGVSVTGTYGNMENAFGRSNVNVSVGKKINDLSFVLHAYTGKANRSDRDFTDFYGNTFNMAGNSEMQPANINLGLNYKGLSIRGIYDRYKMTTRDGYGENLSRTFPDDFYSSYLDIKYLHKFSDNFSVTPKFNYIRQNPWFYESDPDIDTTGEYETYYKVTSRYKFNLTANYKPFRKTTVVAGFETFLDQAVDRADSGFFYTGEQSVSYTNYAVFGEAVHKHRIVNFIAGGRFDSHSQYGSTFSPRFGLTKRITKDLHFKALYSHSFRAPGIENINLSLNPDSLKPERTKVGELEVGYQLSRNMIVTINFFDITTLDPIVYYGISDTEQVYMNMGKSGTQGFEVDYKIKEEWGYIGANYAYYTAGRKERIETAEVVDDTTYLLGFAKQSANATCHFNLTPHVGFTTSVNYRGSRYAYTGIDNAGDPVAEKLNPVALVNIYFSFEDVFAKGLNFGAGVFDFFNTGAPFIQPYNSFHAPLPGPSREVVFKLSYDLGFKK